MKKKNIVVLSLIAIVVISLGTYYVFLASDGPEEATKVQEEVPRSKNPTE